MRTEVRGNTWTIMTREKVYIFTFFPTGEKWTIVKRTGKDLLEAETAKPYYFENFDTREEVIQTLNAFINLIFNIEREEVQND